MMRCVKKGRKTNERSERVRQERERERKARRYMKSWKDKPLFVRKEKTVLRGKKENPI